MTVRFVPVVLAGGKGERFWPLSRYDKPKQFLSLDGSGRTLLQNTVARLPDWAEAVWVITRASLVPLVREQLPDLPPERIVGEPEPRDTAPAVAWITWELQQRYGPETVVGIFPADHWIPDVAAFQHTLAQAVDVAAHTQSIVTLGIQPTHPATGYGYIQRGEPVTGGAYRVQRFTEKPDAAQAVQMLATGEYYWNGGMFIFPAEVMWRELTQYAPAIAQPLQERGIAAYGELPKISIDYAVMEHTQRAVVLPVNFPWDDLGDWRSLERLPTRPLPVQHVDWQSAGVQVYSTNPQELIATLGLKDVVIVRDGAVTLVVAADRTQDIKKLLAHLHTQGHGEYL
ncbi:MAG: sugar phosphate nucleotidyltransferase [Gloeomargarita sp. SKYG116]|nr:sugar phosphate nucleotidyltransferase [Gloeomargarita sp. SKYG116]MDW8401715.1 sugar phosphate nucleotidyltransferase [Gloeomargarita sp. SKYGB_i_bin116]